MCDTYLLSVNVSNTKSATKPIFKNDEEENCNSILDMPQKLTLNSVKSGEYVADLNSKDMQLSYFDFTTEGTLGPYLFYF